MAQAVLALRPSTKKAQREANKETFRAREREYKRLYRASQPQPEVTIRPAD